MIAFIDDHRGAYGVEPICKVLPIAPSTYHAHAAKRANPAKLSARAKRDAVRKIEIRRVFAENFDVDGVRKVWRQLRREGEDIARCAVERLMRSLGQQGVIRGKPVKTTISDKAAPCPLDHPGFAWTIRWQLAHSTARSCSRVRDPGFRYEVARHGGPR
jgi:putative transposase